MVVASGELEAAGSGKSAVHRSVIPFDLSLSTVKVTRIG
jgi:hypothetical protein